MDMLTSPLHVQGLELTCRRHLLIAQEHGAADRSPLFGCLHRLLR